MIICFANALVGVFGFVTKGTGNISSKGMILYRIIQLSILITLCYW